MQYELPNGYLSASALTTLLTCPRMYEFRYVERLPTPPTASMLTGSAIHRTLESYYRGVIDNPVNRLSASQVQDLAMAAFEDTVTSEENYMTAAEREDASATVRELSSSYVENVGREIIPIAVEEQYVCTARCGVPLLAYIDLRRRYPDGSEGIVDYKVTARKWTLDKLINSLQFNLYTMITGINDIEVHNLLKVASAKRIAQPKQADDVNDIAPNLRVLRHYFDGSTFDHLETLIERAVMLITSGIFMPCAMDAWNCTPDFCGYWHLCRGKLQAESFDLAA